MADKPNPTLPAPIIAVSDTPHAPFIFYDGVAAFGFANGIINLTLAAGRTYVGPDGGVVTDHVVTAYLRGNIQALLSLKQSIESVLLLAARTGQAQAS